MVMNMIYIFIILLTCLIASKSSLMYENITIVSNIKEYRYACIAYLIFISLFFGYKLYKLYSHNHLSRKYNLLILTSICLMIVGAFAPYIQNSNDLLSNIHVYCCMFSCLLLGLLIFILLYKVYHYKDIYQYYKHAMSFLIFLIIVFGRISGYIEIIFMIIVCLCLFAIEKK